MEVVGGSVVVMDGVGDSEVQVVVVSVLVVCSEAVVVEAGVVLLVVGMADGSGAPEVAAEQAAVPATNVPNMMILSVPSFMDRHLCTGATLRQVVALPPYVYP